MVETWRHLWLTVKTSWVYCITDIRLSPISLITDIRLSAHLFASPLYNVQSLYISCCSETPLTGGFWFHINTSLGIEPGSLRTGSKWVVHWTSET